MKVVRVEWQPDEARFSVAGGHELHEIVVNAPQEGPPTGFSAAELLLAGVGTCSAWDVLEILRKTRQQIRGLAVAVEGEQDPEPPWAYRRIAVRYQVTGQALDREVVERAVALSTEKYCSVIATVRGVASIETSVDLVEEAEIQAEESARIIR